MDDFNMREKSRIFLGNGVAPDSIRYPPNSTPPMGFNHVQKIKQDFTAKSASMLPKLQDFNKMLQQQSDLLINMNKSIFPPGHPMYSRENSLIILKEENDKLLKENLELKKQLETGLKKEKNP